MLSAGWSTTCLDKNQQILWSLSTYCPLKTGLQTKTNRAAPGSQKLSDRIHCPTGRRQIKATSPSLFRKGKWRSECRRGDSIAPRYLQRAPLHGAADWHSEGGTVLHPSPNLIHWDESQIAAHKGRAQADRDGGGIRRRWRGWAPGAPCFICVQCSESIRQVASLFNWPGWDVLEE